MKNVSEILNSILQKAADSTAVQKSPLTGSQGTAEDIGSFEDVLSRLASQAQDPDVFQKPVPNSSALALPANDQVAVGSAANSASVFEASVSMTEVDIQIFGAAPVDGFTEWDLQRLEQSILSLAAGLAKLLNLVSNFQDLQAGRARDLLSSFGNGKISQADIDQLFVQLSAFNQNTDPSMNPLSLSASQQASLLAQMLQSMLQNQQVLLAQNQDSLKADQVPAIGSGNKSAVYGMSLQFVFSDTEVIQFQQSGNRQSVFAMDLHTMTLNMTSVSAFAGDSIPAEISSGSSSLLSSDVVNRLSQLLSDLQVKPNTEPLVSVSTTANTSSVSAGLMQNFKDLVHMLSQAGASQAVLSTLINQQKELSTNDLKQAFFQTPVLDDLLKSLESAAAAASANQVSLDNNRQPALLLNQGNLSNDTVSMRAQLALIDNMVARLNLTTSQGSIADANVPEKNIMPGLLMNQLINQISQYQPETRASTVLNPADVPKTQLLMGGYLIEASQFQQTTQMQSSAVGNNNNLQPLGVFAVNTAKSVDNSILLNTPTVTAPSTPIIPQANSAVQSLSSTIATAIAFTSTQQNTPAGRANESARPNIQVGNPVVPVMQPLEAQAVVPVASTVASATQMEISLNTNSTPNSDILASGKALPLDNDGIPVIPLASNLVLNSASLAGEKIKITSMGPGSTTGANIIQDNSVNSLLIARQVADQIASHTDKNQMVSRLSFQLIPESLGRVTVQIVLIDQTMSARITVVNPVVKESLDHHMIELKTALNQAGLQINQLDVQVQGNSANLLAQYYQYQQEGFGYQMSAYSAPQALEGSENLQNTDNLVNYSVKTSLVDLLV